jgi:uncharacterized integral membrane protein
VVVIWLAVLTAVAVHYIRKPRVFGATRLLLLVVAIDTIRNLVENVYFGLLFGSQSGLFSSALAGSLRVFAGRAKVIQHRSGLSRTRAAAHALAP